MKKIMLTMIVLMILIAGSVLVFAQNNEQSGDDILTGVIKNTEAKSTAQPTTIDQNFVTIAENIRDDNSITHDNKIRIAQYALSNKATISSYQPGGTLNLKDSEGKTTGKN